MMGKSFTQRATYYLLYMKSACKSFPQFRLRRQHILLAFQMTSNHINEKYETKLEYERKTDAITISN